MSLSDFDSDLTELSSDDEEYVPTSQKKKASTKTKGEYKVCHCCYHCIDY